VKSLKEDPNLAYQNSELIRDISCLYETNEIFHIRASKGIFNKNILISQQNNRIKCYSRIDKEKYYGDEMIHGVAGNSFISIIPTSFYSKTNWLDRIEDLKIPVEQKYMLRSINESANPVIILFQFSEF